MEEVKLSLPGLERSVDQLSQHMAKMMQTMEETQKAISSVIHHKADSSKKVEEGGSDCITGESVPTNQFQSHYQTSKKGKATKGSRKASEGRVIVGMSQYWEENNWRQVRKLDMPIFSGENPDG